MTERQNDLREKGIRKLVSELDLYEGTLEFLGIIRSLEDHFQILRVTNPASISTHSVGYHNDSFLLYNAVLKERADKDSIEKIVRDVSHDEPFKIIDLMAPKYYMVTFRYGTFKIQFYPPEEKQNA